MEITKSDITKHESTAIPIGLINLDKKLIGKRNAGNPPVAFDEEGAGNTIKTCACSRPYKKEISSLTRLSYRTRKKALGSS